MSELYNNIALRALNQTRTLNPITYLGIRCLFDNLSEKTSKSGLLEDLLRRKLLVRKEWPFKHNKLYKEKINDKFEYREIISLSPFGVISESFIMREIHKNKCYDNKENVHSYLLPQYKTSNRNYQYYFNGYKKRNENITKVFNENQQDIALVLDLEKFYPSINKSSVKDKILQNLKKHEYDIHSLGNKIITSILDSSKNGVPIGPDLSHLIAQIYLEDFDRKMCDKYDIKYFRYVDDIIVICNIEDKKDIINFIEDTLPEELNIKESKTCELFFDDWNILNQPNDKENENFNDILSLMTAFISMYPAKIDDLENKLNNNNYNIPIKRIREQSKSKSYFKFLEYKIKYGEFSVFQIYAITTFSIIMKLDSLRSIYLNKFNNLIKLSFSDEENAENRSNTQQLKFILNRLLYLFPLPKLAEIYPQIPKTEKFADSREIILALTTQNLTKTLQFGGKVVQTVCELWKENNFELIKLDIQSIIKVTNHLNDIVDSIIIMYLNEVIDFNIEDLKNHLSKENEQYLRVLIEEDYILDNKNTNEYILELYGLFKYKSLEKRKELLFTRFDNDESLQLAGLDLGIGYS